MEVTVEFVGWINRYIQLKNSHAVITISAGCTIQNILELLEVPVDLPQNIVLNGKPASLDTYLHDRDRVQFLPLICGG
ncbi:MAG: MoaD/ThiS family protein [Bacillota bacterium]